MTSTNQNQSKMPIPRFVIEAAEEVFDASYGSSSSQATSTTTLTTSTGSGNGNSSNSPQNSSNSRRSTLKPSTSHGGYGYEGNDEYENETEEERIQREIQEKNERSLIRMFNRHTENIEVSNNMNINRSASLDDLEDYAVIVKRDELQRTTSFCDDGGKLEVMTPRYKQITSGVLWFCYFSLALNDYIFGPTFDDLSKILGQPFSAISTFAVLRQVAYAFGSVGGIAFNYVNRQLCLALMLLISGGVLFVTPYAGSLGLFYLIAILNGFSAGACDVGFHVWILEMFQNGGGPLIQGLHVCFGFGIFVAPLIIGGFLSGESECGAPEASPKKSLIAPINESLPHHFSKLLQATTKLPEHEHISLAETQARIFIPYAIIGTIVCLGGALLIGLFCYKRYVPPKERKLPKAFDAEMPKLLTLSDKLELWKRSVPSFYIILIITIGSSMLLAYYGLEVTYFQFLAQFATATKLRIQGKQAAYLEAMTGGAYTLGGVVATIASFKIHPEKMIYLNFILMNIGTVILYITSNNPAAHLMFWVANFFVGLGFSSCYATAYTFLEHQINVTNLIGSIFLFAGGMGTAIFPLFLRTICTHPENLIYLVAIAANLSLVLFIILHSMTIIRSKQVRLIKDQLFRSPAQLTQFKERSLSTLSYEP